MSQRARMRWLGAGVTAATLYALLKAAWGAGASLGVRDPAALERFEASFGDLRWLATWGTVVPALVAVGLLVARARRVGPQRLVRVLCWAGAVVLVVPGTLGTAQALLVVLGVLQPGTDASHTALAPWTFLLTYGCFGVLCAAFVALARR